MGMKRHDARALDHKTLEEIRIRAVERVQAGESPEAVIQALGFTRSCIYTWLARYRNGGWGALRARALKGRPMKIQAVQMRWLYRTVTGKSPLQFRFEFALWTREMIRILLREQFDLQLSVASVGRLLKQLGLSCQRPLFRAFEQDPKQVRRWLVQECPSYPPTSSRGGGRPLFWRRSGGAIGPSCGDNLGHQGTDAGGAEHGVTKFGQHDFGGERAGTHALHVGQGQSQRGGVCRVSEALDA